MADEIIKQIASDPDFKQSLVIQYNDFDSLSIVNKAAESNKLFVNYKKLEAAMHLAGETIKDLDIEVETVYEKLSSYGEYDQEEINKKIQYKKINSSNEEDNKRIRNRLPQTLLKAKTITNK